ncbi:hypothetical protein HK096_003152 [Nowakowskiella sp. JEL0078]|nr:hypothetical protein HK096_003152 [Nowakowskiella sp. JEL0078]
MINLARREFSSCRDIQEFNRHLYGQRHTKPVSSHEQTQHLLQCSIARACYYPCDRVWGILGCIQVAYGAFTSIIGEYTRDSEESHVRLYKWLVEQKNAGSLLFVAAPSANLSWHPNSEMLKRNTVNWDVDLRTAEATMTADVKIQSLDNSLVFHNCIVRRIRYISRIYFVATGEELVALLPRTSTDVNRIVLLHSAVYRDIGFDINSRRSINHAFKERKQQIIDWFFFACKDALTIVESFNGRAAIFFGFTPPKTSLLKQVLTVTPGGGWNGYSACIAVDKKKQRVSAVLTTLRSYSVSQEEVVLYLGSPRTIINISELAFVPFDLDTVCSLLTKSLHLLGQRTEPDLPMAAVASTRKLPAKGPKYPYRTVVSTTAENFGMFPEYVPVVNKMK